MIRGRRPVEPDRPPDARFQGWQDSWRVSAPGGSTPPPGTARTIGYALTGLATLAGLTWIEISRGGGIPLAALLSGAAAFALIAATRLETAFALILVLTPFSAEVVFRGTGSALQIPTEPMLFVALSLWGLRFLTRGSTRFEQPALVGMMLVSLAACLASLFGSTHQAHAVKAVLNATWYGLFGLFILNNFGSRERLRGLIAAWMVPAVLLIFYSFGNVLAGHYYRWAGYFWSEPFFVEHGTFAAYLSFVFALALALTIEFEGSLKWLFGAVAFLSGVQVVLSMTRGAWVGLAALAPFMALVSWRRLARPVNRALITLGAVAIISVLFLTHTAQDVQKHSGTITQLSDTSNRERFNRWYAGWKMFVTHPVRGVGMGTYPDNYPSYRSFLLSTNESTRYMGVHSEYLRVLSETGLLGLAAAAATLLVMARMARRAIRQASDPLLRGLAVGMAGGLITYLTHSVFNNYIAFDKAAVPVWTAVGVLGAIDRLTRGSS